MPDREPPTPGEMWRRLDDIRGEVRDGFRGNNERLDKLVSVDTLKLVTERWQVELQNIKDDVAELKRQREGDHTMARQARQWAVMAVLAALGIVGTFVALIGRL